VYQNNRWRLANMPPSFLFPFNESRQFKWESIEAMLCWCDRGLLMWQRRRQRSEELRVVQPSRDIVFLGQHPPFSERMACRLLFSAFFSLPSFVTVQDIINAYMWVIICQSTRTKLLANFWIEWPVWSMYEIKKSSTKCFKLLCCLLDLWINYFWPETMHTIEKLWTPVAWVIPVNKGSFIQVYNCFTLDAIAKHHSLGTSM